MADTNAADARSRLTATRRPSAAITFRSTGDRSWVRQAVDLMSEMDDFADLMHALDRMRCPCASTAVGKGRPIIDAGDRRTAMIKISTRLWSRIGGWIARLILVLAIALEIHTWLDVFVFQPEEYERLIGGESGCGKFKSFCSWPAFVLDQVPFTILSILAAIGVAVASPTEARTDSRRACRLGHCLLGVELPQYPG